MIVNTKTEKNLQAILGLFYIIYLLITTSRRAILWHAHSGFQKQDLFRFLFRGVVIEAIVALPLILTILIITKYMFRRNFSTKKIFFISIIFSIVTSVIFPAIHSVLYYFFVYGKGSILKSVLNGIIGFVNVHFLLYSVTVFIIYTFYSVKRANEIELQKITLKHQLTDAKNNILKYQLHPHFFFNTLNSITTLIDVNPKLAQETLVDFSDFLREIVYLKNSNFISLEEEISLLKKYLDIMSVRFSDQLTLNFKIENNIEDVKVPSLLLQPILENSFKYGYVEEIDRLIINIIIYKNNNHIFFEIENNGKLLKENFKFGTGLTNTVNRLETLYEDDFIFEIKNNSSNSGVVTKIAFGI